MMTDATINMPSSLMPISAEPTDQHSIQHRDYYGDYYGLLGDY